MKNYKVQKKKDEIYGSNFLLVIKRFILKYNKKNIQVCSINFSVLIANWDTLARWFTTSHCYQKFIK